MILPGCRLLALSIRRTSGQGHEKKKSGEFLKSVLKNEELLFRPTLDQKLKGQLGNRFSVVSVSQQDVIGECDKTKFIQHQQKMSFIHFSLYIEHKRTIFMHDYMIWTLDVMCI